MKPDQEAFHKVLSFRNHLKNDFADFEEFTRETYRVVIGPNQWKPADVKKMNREKRPINSYNMLLPILLYLVGTQRQSRNAMRTVGIGEDDEQKSDVMTSLMFWNFNKTFFEYEFSKQFIHSVIAGISWAHNRFNFVKGHWEYVAHDPLRIRYDRQTSRAGFQNCRYLQDEQWLTPAESQQFCDDIETLKEIKYRYDYLLPRMNKSAFYEQQYSGSWRWDTSTNRRRDDYMDLKEGRFLTVDHHERRDYIVKFFFNPDNARQYINATNWEDAKIEAFQSQYENWSYQEHPKEIFHTTKITPAIDMVIDDAPYKVQTGMFSWTPMVCYDISPFISDSIGVFHNAIDPQHSYNKREATILETLMDGVSAAWIVEDKSIQDYLEEWENNERRPYRRYKKGTTPPFKGQQTQPAEGLFRYSDNEPLKIEKTTGINSTLQGRNQYANESAAMYVIKIEQSLTMLAFLFDNVDYAKRMAATSCIKHIQYGMTAEQTIRLLDKESNPYWLPLNYKTIDGVLNDITSGDYDLEVDETKPSPTARRLNYYQALEFAKSGMPPELMAMGWDLIVNASDLSFKGEWTKRIRSYFKKQGIDITDPDQIYNFPSSQNQQQGQNQNMIQNTMSSAPQLNPEMNSMFIQ